MKKNSSKVGEKNLKPYIFGVIMAVAVTFLLLIAAAFVMTIYDVSSSVIHPITTSAAAIGAFFGGFFTAARIKQNGMKNGFIIGAIIFLIMFIIGVIVRGFDIGVLTLVRLVVLTLCSAIGGISAVNIKSRRKMAG